MTETRFRQLLVLYIAYTRAAAAASFVPGGYSRELANALASEPEPLLVRNLWLLLGLLIPLLGAIVAGLVGLFRFKPWGRSISLYATLAGFALVPLGGPTLSSPLEDALWGVSEILWGAILASAYFSAVAGRFGANNSFKPNPLRGSA